MGHAAVRAQLLVTAPLTAAFPDPTEAVCIRSQNLDGYRLIQSSSSFESFDTSRGNIIIIQKEKKGNTQKH